MKRTAAEICFICPTKELTRQARVVADARGKNIDVILCSLSEAAEEAQKRHKSGTRVFISRRGTKAVIEQHLSSPVVSIEITINDYVKILRQVKELGGKVGFFTYSELPEEVMPICDLLNIDIATYRFTNEEDTAEGIRQAIKDGVTTVIGGALTKKCAERHKLPCIIVENSEESIAEALATAEQILNIQKDEEKKQFELKLKLERYETFFNYTNDGIIATDKRGTVVVCNKIAAKILGNEDGIYLGRHIQDAIPHSRAMQVMASGVKEINQLMDINGTLVSTNRVPIVIDDEIVSVVLTFSDVKTIQDREQKIRIKLHNKGQVAKHTFADIIGKSSIIRDVKSIGESYAHSDSTVLILGETGTGKELFAQSIHNASGRQNAPFLAINCAALPKNLLEAELFGYEEGAFTGALKGGKPGLFENAHGGTIFLDEITEMPLDTQAHLLRVLQEKEIRRIGSDRLTPIDIRVVSASNRDLRLAIQNGTFRQDLFYRLDVLRLSIPPLRERKSDIPQIGCVLLRLMNDKLTSGYFERFESILKQMKKYDWPGNVRELQNFVERYYALMMHGDGKKRIDTLIKSLLENIDNATADTVHDLALEYKPAGSEDLHSWEKTEILNALKENNLALARTAQALKISRSTLWRKLKKYGIDI